MLHIPLLGFRGSYVGILFRWDMSGWLGSLVSPLKPKKAPFSIPWFLLGLVKYTRTPINQKRNGKSELRGSAGVSLLKFFQSLPDGRGERVALNPQP